MNQSTTKPDSFVHQHAMRRIELTYMPGVTVLTKEDEQLLEKYLQLHDFEYNLLKKAESLFEVFYPLEKKITDLKEGLTKIKKRLDEAIEMADKLSGNFYVPDETNLDKIREHNDVTIEELKVYNEQHINLYNEIKCQQEKLNNCIYESNEVSDNMYEEHSAASDVHNQHYLINTIDIVSLDSDLEDFRLIQNINEKRRITFMDLCDDILVAYNDFNLETNTLYGVWNEFLKRCELMQVVSNLRSSQTFSSFN
jgi:hypothetical protein